MRTPPGAHSPTTGGSGRATRAKVWPQEVEAALREHPKVADVRVGGRLDPEWGQRVVVFVVPADPASPPTLEELRRFVGSRIGRHKAPRELVLEASLVRTASGKVRRSATDPGADAPE
jgi:acyl-CoA synthetase (AMP-forming)/AMP-acid ligase II